MNEEQLIHRIKYLRDVENLSFHQIEGLTGIPRRKCSRIYLGKVGDQTPKKFLLLEPYRQLISEWYAQYPSLLATQVYERLKHREVKVGYTSVKRFTRQFRTKRKRCYWELTFEPGEEAQVDWFVVTHPVLGKLAGFAYVLSFSRYLYACLLPRMSFEFFVEGHLRAFKYSGGIPRGLRYDNLKSVVLRRAPLTYNPGFLAFAHFFSFEIRLCNVRAGNEKGRVERAIRTIRQGFLSTADCYQSLPALNAALSDWLKDYNDKPHRTTGKPPSLLMLQERLRPLPVNEWLNRVVQAPILPTKTGFIIFETNRYSIPEYLVGQRLSVHSFVDRIDIYDSAEKRVASHPRSFKRNESFLNPIHRSFTKIAQSTKSDRIYVAMKKLDSDVARFLELSEVAGQFPKEVSYVLFQLLRNHPRASLLSAIREALAQNVARVQFVQALLLGDACNCAEEVRPLNSSVLNLTYTPRSLEEYSK